ncbi:MAG: hypothetical protein RJA20_2869 [Bacteroidota bacterium]|jgi:hypothetical protein
MFFHGNSKNNEKLHHVYAIYDEEDGDVFKYGISETELGKDDYSRRMREQVDYLNRAVGWARYRAEVIVRDIAGKAHARLIEDEKIAMYIEKFGRPPRGNVKTPGPHRSSP